MPIVTSDQEYILFILQATKVMRRNQAYRLLGKLDGRKTADYANRSLEQLRLIQKIAWKSQDVFTLPLLYFEPVDEGMLSAIDVMLDLTDNKVLAVSAGCHPYKLSFISERDNRLRSFAVIIVRPGFEDVVTASLSGAGAKNVDVIFLLSALSQKDGITTSLPHFFAVYDGKKFRYYRGGAKMPRQT